MRQAAVVRSTRPPRPKAAVLDRSDDLRLVGYLRVSTDDKNQDPERQQEVIEAWARQRGHAIVAWIADEGTSGTVNPFRRQHFLEAVQVAHDMEADGLAVEDVDRWTRGGVEDWAVSKWRLRHEHGLVIKHTKAPAGLTPEMEELWDSMMAAAARAFIRQLRERVTQGLARAKAKGWPKGKPGRGLRKCALEISRLRGAFEFVDPKKRAQVSVSETWLRYMLEHGRKPMRDRSSRPAADGRLGARPKQDDGLGVRT